MCFLINEVGSTISVIAEVVLPNFLFYIVIARHWKGAYIHSAPSSFGFGIPFVRLGYGHFSIFKLSSEAPYFFCKLTYIYASIDSNSSLFFLK